MSGRKSGPGAMEKVLKVIEELGGTASYREIRQLLRKKYPTKTLHKYVYNVLPEMRQVEKVERIEKDGEIYWRKI